MAIFAISDLHLSFKRSVSLYDINPELDIQKPMELFGWNQHYNLIRDNWLRLIDDTDTVLIPGDVSWALKLNEAMNDFNWINQLPGRKIISPGNHCYYAQSKSKMRKALPANIEWIDGDITTAENYVIAATRGWVLPGDRGYREEQDRHIYQRQLGRLRIALEMAESHHPDKSKIVMLHFPPMTNTSTESGFIDILREYNVDSCVYGHMHGSTVSNVSIDNLQGINFNLVSCDTIDYCPIKIK